MNDQILIWLYLQVDEQVVVQIHVIRDFSVQRDNKNRIVHVHTVHTATVMDVDIAWVLVADQRSGIVVLNWTFSNVELIFISL